MSFTVNFRNVHWLYKWQSCLHSGIARSKRDGTCAETRFGLSAKRTSPFKSAGVSVQSTAGSRRVRSSGRRLYRPCSDVQCKAAGYPLHSHLSHSIPLPCVTVCQQVPNALYQHKCPRGFGPFCGWGIVGRPELGCRNMSEFFRVRNKKRITSNVVHF